MVETLKYLRFTSLLSKENKREKELKELREIRKRLKLAYAKLLMAQSFISNRSVRRSLMTSAILTGSIAVMPDFMHSLYLKSSISEIRKALKRVKRVIKGERTEERRIMLERLSHILSKVEKVELKDMYKIILEAQDIIDSMIVSYPGDQYV